MPMYFGGHGGKVLRTVPFSCRIMPYRFSTTALLVTKIKIKKNTNTVANLFQGLLIELSVVVPLILLFPTKNQSYWCLFTFENDKRVPRSSNRGGKNTYAYIY